MVSCVGQPPCRGDAGAAPHVEHAGSGLEVFGEPVTGRHLALLVREHLAVALPYPVDRPGLRGPPLRAAAHHVWLRGHQTVLVLSGTRMTPCPVRPWPSLFNTPMT